MSKISARLNKAEKKECKQINNDIKKYCGQNISSSNTPEIKSDPSTINKDENANWKPN